MSDHESNPPLPDVSVLARHNFKWLENHLRNVPILGDKKKFPDEPEKWRRPYEKATIKLRRVPLSLLVKSTRPLSLYSLERKVPLFRAFVGQIFYEKGIDVLRLTNRVAALEFNDSSLIMPGERLEAGQRLLIPPIVEYSLRDNMSVVVDGLHRLLYAMELAAKRVNRAWEQSPIDIARGSSLEVSLVNISKVLNNEQQGHTPLAPLPVAWERVVQRTETPPNHLKRVFGYDVARTLEVREIYGGESYAMFRDFGKSGGIRPISAQTKTSPGNM